MDDLPVITTELDKEEVEFLIAGHLQATLTHRRRLPPHFDLNGSGCNDERYEYHRTRYFHHQDRRERYEKLLKSFNAVGEDTPPSAHSIVSDRSNT